MGQENQELEKNENTKDPDTACAQKPRKEQSVKKKRKKEQVPEEHREQELTVEEGLKKLDQVIAALEDRETSLEDSFRIYQEGMELLKLCSEKIDRVEKKVLIMDEEGDLHEF